MSDTRGWKLGTTRLAGLIGVCLLAAAASCPVACSQGNDPSGPRGTSDVGFDFSPDGRRIVFTAQGDGFRDLYLLDLQTWKVTRIARTPGWEQEPRFSPDGGSILYAASERLGQPTHIYLRRLADGRIQKLTSGAKVADGSPAFGPDGKTIFFVRAARHRPYAFGGWVWDHADVYETDTNASPPRALTHASYAAAGLPPHPVTSRREIVFEARDSTGFFIYRIPLPGGAPVVLRRNASSPALSRDGTQLVYVADDKKKYWYQVHTMRADGTQPVQVTHSTTNNYCTRPAFHPDGSRIFYLTTNSPTQMLAELWEVGIDGAHERRIAGTDLFTDPLKWRH